MARWPFFILLMNRRVGGWGGGGVAWNLYKTPRISIIPQNAHSPVCYSSSPVHSLWPTNMLKDGSHAGSWQHVEKSKHVKKYYHFTHSGAWQHVKKSNYVTNYNIVLMQAPDNMPLYVTVAATFLYFVIPFTIVLFLYLRWLYFYILSLMSSFTVISYWILCKFPPLFWH